MHRGCDEGNKAHLRKGKEGNVPEAQRPGRGWCEMRL